MGGRSRLLAVVVLAVAVALPEWSALPRGAGASSGGSPCSTGYARRREVAHGRFLDKRWHLELFRGRSGRPCLVDGWRKYGSIFRFRVREHRPRLGVLNLAVTTAPGRSVYVANAYVGERVERVTFRIDGRRRKVRIIRTPGWTRLPKDLFILFIGGRRYDDDRTGRLRAFGAGGRLLTTRILRRRDFFQTAEPD